MTSIERTGDRIRATKRMQRQRGRYLGGIAPWGWIKGADGELVPIPELQTAIARMRRMRAEGVSLRKIMERMVDEGHAITLPTLMRLTAQHLPPVDEMPRGGAVPFGYQRDADGKPRVPVPEQQEAIGQIHRLRAEGLSLRAISARLADNGIKLSHNAVGRMIAAERGEP
jgi:uncharacterized protein YoaH (UPF0181 family)